MIPGTIKIENEKSFIGDMYQRFGITNNHRELRSEENVALQKAH